MGTQKGKEAMERFKMESASEVGVTLKQGYNGDLTAREGAWIHRRADGEKDDRRL